MGVGYKTKKARLSSSHKIDTRRTLFIFFFFRVVPRQSIPGLERADSEVIQPMGLRCMVSTSLSALFRLGSATKCEKGGLRGLKARRGQMITGKE